MKKTDGELNVVLELTPWAKIGKLAMGVLLIGCGIYYISIFDLIERFWMSEEFKASPFDGSTLYIMIAFILFWFAMGLFLLIPRRVRFDDDGITKRRLLGERRLPYPQVDHLRLTHNSIYINRGKPFVLSRSTG